MFQDCPVRTPITNPFLDIPGKEVRKAMLTDNKQSSIETVFVGVDTHKDTHTAVVVTAQGAVIDEIQIDTTTRGYKQLNSWANSHGKVGAYGIEGTGCYGKNLTQYLTSRGVEVFEINRINRQHRRRHGKNDVTDALAAGRAVASGAETNPAKEVTDNTEIVRVIQLARRSAAKARTVAISQIKTLLVTAPESIQNELKDMTTLKMVREAADWRPTNYLSDPVQATRHAIKKLAKRWLYLTEEIKQADQNLETVINNIDPELMELQGIGTDVAAKLVITAGTNPKRLRTEASFAALCGVSPIDASSGLQQRHRLNRGGDRQANNALYKIVITRMNHDPETKKYVTKKTGQGKTKKEIIRQLKRYIARQIYKKLNQNLT